MHKNSVYLMELLRRLSEITLDEVLDFAKCSKISIAHYSERRRGIGEGDQLQIHQASLACLLYQVLSF